MKYKDEFNVYLRIDKSYSQNTIDTYLTNLKIFSKYCLENNIDIEKVEYADLSIYLEHLKKNYNYSTKSLSLTISSLKCYYRFLMVENYIKNNPSSLLKLPKVEKKYPEYLTIDEIERVFSVINTSNRIGKRNYLLLMLLYDTGVRISELLNIKLNDIDFYNKTIKILGKGNKERIVFFTKETLSILNEYISEYYNKFEIKNHYLFGTNNGKILTRMEVYNLIKKYCVEAKIEKNVSPHTIRHSFATHMIQNDADIMTVKTILGHSKVSTTQIYTHLNKKDLKAKYDAIKERND